MPGHGCGRGRRRASRRGISGLLVRVTVLGRRCTPVTSCSVSAVLAGRRHAVTTLVRRAALIRRAGIATLSSPPVPARTRGAVAVLAAAALVGCRGAVALLAGAGALVAVFAGAAVLSGLCGRISEGELRDAAGPLTRPGSRAGQVAAGMCACGGRSPRDDDADRYDAAPSR
jgi:hypothetical protein